MDAVRDRLTYANVMATAALFVALGGVAWALDSSKGSNPSTPAIGLLGGEVVSLGSGAGSEPFNPVGGELGTGSETLLAPRELIATSLRVELQSPLAVGERTFLFGRNGAGTALRCTITAPDTSCRSNERVRFRKGDIISAVEQHDGAVGLNDASFGWIAQKG